MKKENIKENISNALRMIRNAQKAKNPNDISDFLSLARTQIDIALDNL